MTAPPGHFPVTNHYPTVTVAVDFDGYLAPAGTEGPPHPQVQQLLAQLAADGWQVIVASARPVAHVGPLWAWIAHHQVACHQVVCGAKPPADAFLDDKAPQLPWHALAEWLLRVSERRAGLDPVAQVTAGEGGTEYRQQLRAAGPQAVGEQLDPQFRVLLPFSGGLDSATALLLAHRAGLPVVPVYVDTGVPYSPDEIAAARGLLQHLHGPELLVRQRPIDYPKGWGFVDLGRNEVIVDEVAAMALDRGWWGEVWLAAIDQPGEMPVVGGDKSHRWLASVQHLLTGRGMDLRVQQPLAGWTKQDAVAWWDRQVPGGAQTAADWTWSCYVPGGPCGRCRACLRRWVAFHGTAATVRWPAGHDLTGEVIEARLEEQAGLDSCTAAGGSSVLWAAPRVAEWHEALDAYEPQEAAT